MPVAEVPSVAALEPVIHSFLDSQSEPPVGERECAELVAQLKSIGDEESNVSTKSAALETILRDTFDELVATTEISSPEFSRVWILLDVVTTLSDHELCEPGFSFYLVEDLLDSQTIDGCRKVFDYLESRRERMTAKHFKPKSLVILRCCNELLRRLSRAEDTVFCGRVFIFLFQSFPLGDRSSVNLRGEFHVENVTTYDPIPEKSENAIKPMELDLEVPIAVTSEAATPASSAAQEPEPSQKTARSTPSTLRPAKLDVKVEEPPPDLDSLYPVFWSLQSYFSSPTRLFEPTSMNSFKEGLKQTLACFRSVSNTAVTSSNNTENSLKRKRDAGGHPYSTFNPKYLTNRDLFDLEIHDIAFRRHILVQSLIMIDFLLALTPSAKSKVSGATNKAVLYSYTLPEDDAKWAQSTRAAIASYLQQGNGNEGKFYYRMVDTVLSRDKNWVRWKAESCPVISRPPIDVQTHLEAQNTLMKLCVKISLPAPPGATELEFLDKVEALESLKNPAERLQLPTMEDYYKGIETDDLDMDFATEEEKKDIEERKAGRLWRALRSSRRRFVLCEQIENGANLGALVGQTKAQGDGKENGVEPAEKIEQVEKVEQAV